MANEPLGVKDNLTIAIVGPPFHQPVSECLDGGDEAVQVVDVIRNNGVVHMLEGEKRRALRKRHTIDQKVLGLVLKLP